MTEITVSGSTDNAKHVKFNDLRPSVDSEQALAFLDALFTGTRGYVGLSMLPTGSTRKTSHNFDTWVNAREQLTADPGFWDVCLDDWRRWNAYVQVGSTLKTLPAAGSRGQQSNARELLGMFADLDVGKTETSFRDRAELDTFLAGLPPVTMLVESGSGGLHPYWLYDRPHVIENVSERRELDGWYDYLQVHAGAVGRAIDHVQDYARILRVPGTIRWPRRGQSGAWKPVRLVTVDGPRYSRDELLELTEPHRQVAVKRHSDLRDEWHGVRDAQITWLERCGLDRAARSLLEARLNREQDWGPLLEAAGWRLQRDGRGQSGTQDCRHWSRPGKDVRDGGPSGSTDFPGSDVMYIYTDDPVVAPCLVMTNGRFNKITTKYAFALHFLAGGDEEQLIRAIHRGKGQIL